MDINYAYKQFKYWEETGFSKSETPNSEALVMAIEAIEKQIPKSPTNTRFDFIGDAFGGKCECGCVVYEYHTYCPDCGQKVDWEVK